MYIYIYIIYIYIYIVLYFIPYKTQHVNLR